MQGDESGGDFFGAMHLDNDTRHFLVVGADRLTERGMVEKALIIALADIVCARRIGPACLDLGFL